MTLGRKNIGPGFGPFFPLKAGDTTVVAEIEPGHDPRGDAGCLPHPERGRSRKNSGNPERVVSIIDHWVPAPTVEAAIHHQTVRKAVAEYGIRHAYGEKAGICHQVLPEKGHVVPGDLIVGNGFPHRDLRGIWGRRPRASVIPKWPMCWPPERLWFRVPETIQFRMEGKPGSWGNVQGPSSLHCRTVTPRRLLSTRPSNLPLDSPADVHRLPNDHEQHVGGIGR